MNIIRIQKVIAHKKWEYVEVVEGSDEHKAIILWNKVKNAQIYFDKKEQDYETEQRQNEVSMDELREESGFDPIDPDELTPEEYAIKEMIRQILWNEVQSLPELQRDIVVLHIYKGVKLHRKLNKDSQKALIERYELSVSNNKCLLLCPCEKCRFMPIRAPPYRTLMKITNQNLIKEIKA